MNSEISYNNSGNSSLKDNKTNIFEKFININLLWDNIKRHRVLIIITGIVMFFASPFVELLYYVTTRNSYFSFKDVNEGLVPAIYTLIMIISIIYGLCLALTVMKHMRDKKASVFFASIPIKKTTFYITQCLSGLIYFTVPFIAVYLMSVLIMPNPIVFASFTKVFFVCWFIFFLIYSFVIMCANIAGNGLNSVITAIYLTVFLVGWFGIFILFVEIFYRFTSISVITEQLLGYSTAPIMYFIGEIYSNWEHNFVDNVLILLPVMFVLSAAFLSVGGFLNNINKTENAEKPFYFKISQTIFKYTLLAMAVALSGMLFYQGLQQSMIFMIVGIITGGFISFLFINFIINKSMREVFSGFKQFLIFILAACIIMTFLSLDVFRADKYLPKLSEVESIEIINTNNHILSYSVYSRDSTSYRYIDYKENKNIITDPEVIELTTDLIKTAMKSNYMSANDYNSEMYFGRMLGSEISYKLKNGNVYGKKIPYDLNFNNSAYYGEYTNAIKKLYNNKKFLESFFAPLTDLDFMRNLIYNPDFTLHMTSNMKSSEYDYTDNTFSFSRDDLMKFVENINKDIFVSENEFYKPNYTVTDSINIVFNSIYEDENGLITTYTFNIYILESFKNTISFLENVDIYVEEYFTY